MLKPRTTFRIGFWTFLTLIVFDFTQIGASRPSNFQKYQGNIGSFCGRDSDCNSNICLYKKCTEDNYPDGSKKGRKTPAVSTTQQELNDNPLRISKPKYRKPLGRTDSTPPRRSAAIRTRNSISQKVVSSLSRSERLRYIAHELEVIRARTSTTTTVVPDDEGWGLDYPGGTPYYRFKMSLKNFNFQH